MKARESGMPDEAMWESFFDPGSALTKLGLASTCVNVIEFGCGYGTFTIPAAQACSGTVFALDIEPEMVAATLARAAREGVGNVQTLLRDFIAHGTGLPDGCADYAMLFNILHCEGPEALLSEAHRVLRPDGKLAVIHWRSDIPTPRGPTLGIRPDPQRCIEWAKSAGFACVEPGALPVLPYHYGIVFEKSGRTGISK